MSDAEKKIQLTKKAAAKEEMQKQEIVVYIGRIFPGQNNIQYLITVCQMF